MRSFFKLSACAALLIAAPGIASAATYTGGMYEQHFDGLPTTGSVTLTGRGPHAINGVLGATGLDGWALSNYSGSSLNTEVRAHDGSLAGNMGRGVISFGTSASTERALGVQPTSNQISRFGVSFTNDTGVTLNDFILSFTAEQWRRGEPLTHDSISFAYKVTSNAAEHINFPGFTGVGALSFDAPNVQAAPTEVALDGNLAMNQFELSHRVKGVNWGPGQTLMLRWSGSDVGGQDDALAIDDMSFRATVPEPASWILAMVAAASLAMLRRRS